MCFFFFQINWLVLKFSAVKSLNQNVRNQDKNLIDNVRKPKIHDNLLCGNARLTTFVLSACSCGGYQNWMSIKDEDSSS